MDQRRCRRDAQTQTGLGVIPKHAGDGVQETSLGRSLGLPLAVEGGTEQNKEETQSQSCPAHGRCGVAHLGVLDTMRLGEPSAGTSAASSDRTSMSSSLGSAHGHVLLCTSTSSHRRASVRTGGNTHGSRGSGSFAASASSFCSLACLRLQQKSQLHHMGPRTWNFPPSVTLNWVTCSPSRSPR